MKLAENIVGKFSPQLSTDIEKLKEPMTAKLASIKLDGIRALTVDYRAVSRSFKSIENLHVERTLREYQGLDGEIIVGEPNAPDVYRVTDSAVSRIKGEPEFKFFVFDDLTRLDLCFEDRLKVLQDRNLPDWIKVLPQVPVSHREMLDAFYEAALSEGYEGVMARNARSMYKFGRCTAKSQDSLKYKPFKDSEAIVLSVYEAMQNNNEAFLDELGRTARSSHQENLTGKGMVGGFVARDCYTGVVFNLAPGKLTHAERIELWQTPGSCVDRIAKYRHFTVGVKDKPRHPRWIGWRSANDMGGTA